MTTSYRSEVHSLIMCYVKDFFYLFRISVHLAAADTLFVS